ncbi:hypothetical protein ACFCVY_15395 [Streptomyces sp. NPDC056411]|uniref:hypothetical protein n=1 Tax=Streptomyces sp. NPDC056411 TaxID=3345813 RepID=UPI0035D6D502
MYRSEPEIRVRYEELRREADRQRQVREAIDARHATDAPRAAGARSGEDEPGGRVTPGRARWWRTRRATAA